MPDKQKLEPDDQFVDFAWGEMRKLLEEQMPTDLQQERSLRRRFLLLFLFLSMAVVSSGLLWVNFKAGPETIDLGYLPIKLHGEENPAIANVVVSPASVPQEREHPLADQLQEEVKVKATTVNAPTIVKAKRATAIAQEQFLNSPAAQQVITGAQKERNLIETVDELIPSLGSYQKEVTSEAALGEHPSIPVAFLAGLNPTVDQKEEPLLIMPPIAPKRNPRMHWSLEFMALANQDVGFFAGTGLNVLNNFHLGKKGWQLHAGLGISWEKRPVELYAYNGELYSFRYLSDNAGQLGLDTTNSDIESFPITNSSGQVSKLAFNARTYYLNLPVRISKQFGDRWSVFAGGNVGYLLQASGDAAATLDEFNTVAGQGQDANDPGLIYFQNNSALRSTSSDFSPTPLNQWQLALAGGVQYKLTPRLDLGVAYRRNLIGLLKDKEIKKGLGQGYLSLLYRL